MLRTIPRCCWVAGLWLRQRRVFSSRKIERATRLARLPLHCRWHAPDHDTLASFRRRFLDELAGLFVPGTGDGAEMKLLKLGTISLDGTRIKANASRHSALSHGHIEQLEVQLTAKSNPVGTGRTSRRTVQRAGRHGPAGGNCPPPGTTRCHGAAKAKIDARAKVRFEEEQAEFEARVARREQKAGESGKPPGGKPPKPPVAGPKAQDQINLTDEASRIMPVAGGGFDQAYNAQAAVDTASLLVVALRLRKPRTTRSRSCRCWRNWRRCLIHSGRWNSYWPTPVLQRENVQACQTPCASKPSNLSSASSSPSWGSVSSPLRGLKQVAGEWTLVCLAWNLKRMAVLRLQ